MKNLVTFVLAGTLTLGSAQFVYAQGGDPPSSQGLTPNGDMKASDKQKGGGAMKKGHSKKKSKHSSGGM